MEKDYKLKDEDFDVLLGWSRYHKKSNEALRKNDLSFESLKIQLKYFGNECLLIAYNFALFGIGATAGILTIKGLEQLVK